MEDMAGVHSVCTSHQRLVASALVLAESGLNVLITVYISAVRNMREKTTQNKGQVQARERKKPGGMGALGTAEVGKELQRAPSPSPSSPLCRAVHPRLCKEPPPPAERYRGAELVGRGDGRALGHWDVEVGLCSAPAPQFHTSTSAPHKPPERHGPQHNGWDGEGGQRQGR